VRQGFLAILIGLAACSASHEGRVAQAEAMAQIGALERHIWRVGDFSIFGFDRRGAAGQVLVVYLEGDGHAWINPWQPSSDPTPTEPVALQLAMADPARPLIYLARPCQYLFPASCQNRIWTSERLSPAAVQLFQQILDEARGKTGSKSIGLVGYSGGGALAALLAERRQDVAWLITVAANLDLAKWVELQDVEPLSGSLDPASKAAAIERLPQVHFGGQRDRVVPPVVLESFMARLAPSHEARLLLLPGFDHQCCWAAAWPRLLQLSGLRS
jgi:pimeloyl-ACP methyl ester carboxylesterase